MYFQTGETDGLEHGPAIHNWQICSYLLVGRWLRSHIVVNGDEALAKDLKKIFLVFCYGGCACFKYFHHVNDFQDKNVVALDQWSYVVTVFILPVTIATVCSGLR